MANLFATYLMLMRFVPLFAEIALSDEETRLLLTEFARPNEQAVRLMF